MCVRLEYRALDQAIANGGKAVQVPHQPDGLPAWPEYLLDKRKTVLLGENPNVAQDLLGADRELRFSMGAI